MKKPGSFYRWCAASFAVVLILIWARQLDFRSTTQSEYEVGHQILNNMLERLRCAGEFSVTAQMSTRWSTYTETGETSDPLPDDLLRPQTLHIAISPQRKGLLVKRPATANGEILVWSDELLSYRLPQGRYEFDDEGNLVRAAAVVCGLSPVSVFEQKEFAAAIEPYADEWLFFFLLCALVEDPFAYIGDQGLAFRYLRYQNVGEEPAHRIVLWHDSAQVELLISDDPDWRLREIRSSDVPSHLLDDGRLATEIGYPVYVHERNTYLGGWRITSGSDEYRFDVHIPAETISRDAPVHVPFKVGSHN